jgi:hypothetical protein
LLLQRREQELQNGSGYWFQDLEDGGALFLFTRAEGVPTPDIYCCTSDADELRQCFNDAGTPEANFVIKATGLHSNQGSFVFPQGFSGQELLTGIQMSLEDVIMQLDPFPAKVIVSHFISGSTSGPTLPSEYKFHMFNGEMASASVFLNRGTSCACYLEVDENWKRLDMYGCFTPSATLGMNSDEDFCYDIDFVKGSKDPYPFKGFHLCDCVEKPSDCVWSTMLEYARQLSRRIGVYVRIDMFVTDDQRIYVQEYTRFHSGGLRHCAAKEQNGCVNSCFLGQTWKSAGGDAVLGGPMFSIPSYLDGYSNLTVPQQCEVVMNPAEETSTQNCLLD